VGSTSAPRAQAAASAPSTSTSTSTPPSSPTQSGLAATAQEKPEVLVGAAFAGAFLFAKILRAITSSDD
jgi:hypothetical protein